MYVNKWRRYPYHDYNEIGAYFVTICTKSRIPFFGEIVNKQMQLSYIGEIAHKYWLEIPEHFKNVSIDEFIIMPNHIHGIINIVNDYNERPKDRTKMILSKIIQQYKSSVSRNVNRTPVGAADLPHLRGIPHLRDFKWQRSFYDRIIRNDQEYYNIVNYIEGNLANYELK